MKITLQFTTPFIGHKYSKALGEKIDIEKKMNISSKTGEEKRKVAQKAWLEKHGLPANHLEVLQNIIDKEGHWSYDKDGNIIIPGGRIVCAMTDTLYRFGKPLKLKVQRSDLHRYLEVSNFATGRKTCDWKWWRLAIGRDPQGKVQGSGKRILDNEVLGIVPKKIAEDTEMNVTKVGECQPLVVTGEILFDPLAPAKLEEEVLTLLDYCGSHVGIGCSRELGFGYFIREGGKQMKAVEAVKDTGKKKKKDEPEEEVEQEEAEQEEAEQEA